MPSVLIETGFLTNKNEGMYLNSLNGQKEMSNAISKAIIKYKNDFEKKGLIFSALSPDGTLPEIIELRDHPWFVGVQFHPEFKSRPFTPHPLFSSFIKAAGSNRRKN